jgi:hypothetical protein
MKNIEQARALFTTAQTSASTGKPAAPFASHQSFNGRNRPDPSSVVRSDRYPIPELPEYRMRVSE